MEVFLEQVEWEQLQGQRALKVPVAVELDRMPVEDRIHLIDRADMIPRTALDAPIDELIVVHRASLSPSTEDAKIVFGRGAILLLQLDLEQLGFRRA